jgi:two-component system sensor kinase
LKAPVRHIAGFATLLEHKYMDLLPEEGRQYLANILGATKTMGELIDGLLQFSRSGRIEMKPIRIDMNEMVASLIQPIIIQDKLKRIDFQIEKLPFADADFELIKSVWSNLIDNAVKFSKEKEKALIIIGATENKDETTYFVKDNGAGFDMAYVSKLFNVFQRLHSKEDFEGTGIGLATVKQIITKHGGRTWAEGHVGLGATIYFTLNKKKENNGDENKNNFISGG